MSFSDHSCVLREENKVLLRVQSNAQFLRRGRLSHTGRIGKLKLVKPTRRAFILLSVISIDAWYIVAWEPIVQSKVLRLVPRIGS